MLDLIATRECPLSMIGKSHPKLGDPVAGNGILSRRVFHEGALLVSATGAGLSRRSAEPLAVQPWMKVPGPGFAGYGQPSPFESKVVKVFLPPPATPGPTRLQRRLTRIRHRFCQRQSKVGRSTRVSVNDVE